MIDSVEKVGTPEGLTFDLHPAGPVPRLLALLLDTLILFIFMLAALLVASLIGWDGNWFALLLAFVVQAFGMFFLERMTGGSSPGKRAFGLQVVMRDGRPVTPAASVIRNLLRFVDAIGALGWFVPLLTRGFRRLGDLVAGTLVVYKPEIWMRVRSVGHFDQVTPLAPRPGLGPDATWAALEFARRWGDFGPQLRNELAQTAADLYLSPPEGKRPEDALRSVAAWYGGTR